MFARYYNSNVGRFLSPDWSAKIAPVPYAKLDDPQSLNLYSYVRNNPLSRVDPDGHCDKNGWFCQKWAQLKSDASSALKTVNATVEVGVGVKAEIERSGATATGGGSIHGELNYSRNGEKITLKAELDGGVKAGTVSIGKEGGIRTTTDAKDAINGAEPYMDPLKGGLESAKGTEAKGNSEAYSYGGAVYTPDGGGGLHVAVGAQEANQVASDIKNDVLEGVAIVSIFVAKEFGP